MNQFNKNQKLAIDEADFQRVVEIHSEMEAILLNDRIRPGSTGKSFVLKSEELELLLKKSLARGVHPVAGLICRMLQEPPVSEQTIEFLGWLHSRLPMGSSYPISSVDLRTLNATLHAFSFSFADGINVSHWPAAAELGRKMVLAAAEAGDDGDPKYLKAKDDFQKVFGPELDRFAEDPELGKQIRAARNQ